MSYAYDWNGLPPSSSRAAESRALSGADIRESGAPPGHHYPPLAQPPGWIDSPSPGLGFLDLSRNEKRLALVAAAGLGAFIVFREVKRRR